MNFTYFKFLFINTVKRKPVWITWLLFLITCTCFIIILPLAAKMNTLQVWANTTMAICQTFLGMTAALFTSVLAINIFKDTNEEGTELIVISKPITRFNNVLTKFLVFGFFCLVVNISACIITMFTAFLPRTEHRFYWGLIVSMLIGNIVTFGIFGSIAVLMSANFAKVGIIVTNVILSLVFLIYQALTIFCFRIPSIALADKDLVAPSYIVMNRNKTTGEYTEDHVVKFTSNILDSKPHPCDQVVNWQGMKHYWENDILGVDPTPWLNVTDIAGQVSLSYLSVGIDDYAWRQAARMFAVSRFYNYNLTSPASPEILNAGQNKKTLPWMYTSQTRIPIQISEYLDPIYISLPGEFGFCAIPPITSTRLRGYTDLIPVGYVKSKELLSQREVYFEKEDWNYYRPAFDLMYERLFDYHHYIDEEHEQVPEDLCDYDSYFAATTNNVTKYYKLLWNCLAGGPDSLIADRGWTRESLNIKTVDDLNDRFIQFKYYAFEKALDEQHAALYAEPQNKYEKDARDEAVEYLLNTIAYILGLNIEYPTDCWMVRAKPGEGIDIVEQGTQTISYNLIDNTWVFQRRDMDAAVEAGEMTKEQELEYGRKSIRSVMNKTQAIFNTVSYPKENFLFDSLLLPTRNGKYSGDAHIVSDIFVPYPVTWYMQFNGEKAKGPMGHNLQYFYYETTPRRNYWMYAIIWTVISLGLFVAGAVVYNKYDVK